MKANGRVQGRPSEEIKPKKPGVIKQTLLDLGSVPFPALALGMAGLIPFVALAPPLASLLPLPVCIQLFNHQKAYNQELASIW